MDSYQRRPAEWRALAKGYDKEDAPTEATTDGHGKSAGGKKTVPEKKSAIQLARERHMQKTQQQASKHGKTPGSGANAVPTNA
ncbi:Nucleolar protein 9 [Exophiala dermatitidis]|nr:Nucleolar protein 9 [Exophiala dermatitidis]